MIFKDRGIILKESVVGEADKVLTVLLAQRGKTSLFAARVRNPRDRLFAALHPFCLCDFVIKEGLVYSFIESADLLKVLYTPEEDLEAFCYASFFLEMADKLILPGMPPLLILRLLFRAFDALERRIDPKMVASVFQFIFLREEGYSPRLDVCGNCGRPSNSLFFGNEGIICGKCARKTFHVPFGKQARDAAFFILNCNGKDAFSLTLPPHPLNELYAAAVFFRKHAFSVAFNSLELLSSVKT